MTNNAGKVTSCADGRTFQIAAVTKGLPKVSKLWRWEGDNIRSYVRPSFMGIVFGSGILLDLVLFANRIIAEPKS